MVISACIVYEAKLYVQQRELSQSRTWAIWMEPVEYYEEYFDGRTSKILGAVEDMGLYSEDEDDFSFLFVLYYEL